MKQWANLTAAEGQLDNIDPKRVGREIELVATLGEKTSGVMIGFHIEGPAHDDWAVEKAETADGRRVAAEIRPAFAGVNGANIVTARVPTDDKGEAHIHLWASGIGGDAHKVRAFVISPGEQFGEKRLSEEYTTWRKLHVDSWRLDGGKKAEGRVGEFDAVSTVDVSRLKSALSNAFIELHVIDHGKIARAARGESVPAKKPVGPSTSLNGMHVENRPKTSYPASGVPLFHMYELGRPPLEFVHKFNAVAAGSVLATTLPFDLMINESLPDGEDWLVGASAVYAGKIDRTAIDPKYLSSRAPRTVRFAIGAFGQEWRIAPGTPMRVSIRYRAAVPIAGRYLIHHKYAMIGSHRIARGDWSEAERESTMAHELGHAMSLVQKSQPTHAADSDGHCKDPACVMYRASTTTKGCTFCGACTESLRKSPIRLDYA